MDKNTKQYIARQYYPHLKRHSGIRALCRDIARCTQLVAELQKTGYNNRVHRFTDIQKQLIYEYLGEP